MKNGFYLIHSPIHPAVWPFSPSFFTALLLLSLVEVECILFWFHGIQISCEVPYVLTSSSSSKQSFPYQLLSLEMNE